MKSLTTKLSLKQVVDLAELLTLAVEDGVEIDVTVTLKDTIMLEIDSIKFMCVEVEE